MGKDIAQKIAEIARTYGRSVPTIYRWRQGGLDVDDPEAVRAWTLKTMRSSRGEARRQILRGQGTVADSVTAIAPPPPLVSGKDSDNGDGQDGTIGALRRLTNLERVFYERLKYLLNTKRTHHPDLVSMVSIVLIDYTRVSDALRRFQRAVELQYRDINDLIPRKEAIESWKAGVRFMRLGIRRWESACIPEMRTCKDDSDAKAYFERTFPEILTQAVKDGLEAAIPVPQWGLDAIKEEWRIE
jgi:hypothetical protein